MENKKNISGEFSRKLKRALEQKGISPRVALLNLDIPSSTFYGWVSGVSTPMFEGQAFCLCKFLGVSTDFLFGVVEIENIEPFSREELQRLEKVADLKDELIILNNSVRYNGNR